MHDLIEGGAYSRAVLTRGFTISHMNPKTSHGDFGRLQSELQPGFFRNLKIVSNFVR